MIIEYSDCLFITYFTSAHSSARATSSETRALTQLSRTPIISTILFSDFDLLLMCLGSSYSRNWPPWAQGHTSKNWSCPSAVRKLSLQISSGSVSHNTTTEGCTRGYRTPPRVLRPRRRDKRNYHSSTRRYPMLLSK